MEENKNYCVYMHINKINNKKYIGITGRKPEKRWLHGNGYKGSTYFWNAIQKYGWDNFDHEILYVGLTKNEAEQYEINLIKQYDTTNDDYGYNIRYGGSCGVPLSDEIKRKISEKNKGKPSWRKGVPFSDEDKQRISVANMGRTPVFQYDRNTGKFIAEYENLTEASTITEIDKSSIGAVCHHNVKAIGGYIFRYQDGTYINGEPLPEQEYEKSKNTHFRPIKQYEKDGTFIQEFMSIKDAELFFGKKQGSTLIWHCVNRKKPSALNYLWSYSDEEVVIPKSKREKPVNQYSLDGILINTFSTVKSAAKSISGNDSSLIKHIKDSTSYKNYYWKYA